jgi:molybdopterin/thiamine biosynthesis adenylyltransferase
VNGPETFDPASLEAFTTELVAAGFEPSPDTNRRVWKGPIHPAFEGLTDATRMKVLLRDGWPIQFPYVYVEGLNTNHLTEDGYVCLWHEGDGSGDWCTLDGLYGRIAQWCDHATKGWDVHGLARDAYLNFTKKHPAVATFDLDELRADHAGAWGALNGELRHPFHVELASGAPQRAQLAGLWFHVGAMDLPPRNLAELRTALSRDQRRGLDRALSRRRPVDVLERSGGVDLVLFRWDREHRRHLLILGIAGSGDDNEMYALQEGPSDMTSLQLRAGPDAADLANRSIALFGVGALGGHAALCLASSGLGRIRLVDSDQILPGNVVRHAVGHVAVGVPKVHAVAVRIGEHAPWTEIDRVAEHPTKPSRLRELIADVDLVVDATGNVAATSSLAATASTIGKPLVSGALFRGGAIGRVQRQGTPGDVDLAVRGSDARYRLIPSGADEEELVEPAIGCSAPVNNAPPGSVLACSARIVQVAIDALTGRCAYPDEVTDVYTALPGEPPYDQLGSLLQHGNTV